MVCFLYIMVVSLYYRSTVEDKIRKCGSNILLVHTHIPKTGGTTISNVLISCAAQYGKKLAYGHIDNFLNMSIKEQNNIAAVEAHMGFGIEKQPNFPVHRKDCVIYLVIMRPYIDIMWSAMGHIYADKKIEFPTKVKSFTQFNNPWNFQGAISYQLCCFSDSQHPDDSVYSKGHLVKQLSSSQNNFHIDEDCPKTIEEASTCAIKRLCEDYDIIGTTDKLSELIKKLVNIMQCKGTHIKNVHDNIHSLSMRNDTFKRLTTYLKEDGSSFDAAVLKFGMMLSEGDKRGCEKSPRSVLQMHMK